jgi:hypothetical protein
MNKEIEIKDILFSNNYIELIEQNKFENKYIISKKEILYINLNYNKKIKKKELILFLKNNTIKNKTKFVLKSNNLNLEGFYNSFKLMLDLKLND